MKKLFLAIAITIHMVQADLYKETQDFQYSRSSDDQQQKGYYSSQNGNMGGNYELSHNMDDLAHTQMKGLVQQVGGQLGIDPADIGTGRLNQGRLYGSASASGSSYGVKGFGNHRDRYVDNAGSHYRGLQGERGLHSSNMQNGQLYSAQTSGIRENQKSETAHLSSASHSKYATVDSEYEASSNNRRAGTIIEARPGSTLRLQVRPGQAVPLSVPVQVNTRSSDYERRVQEESGLQVQQPNIRFVAMPSSTYGVNYDQRGQTYASDLNYNARGTSNSRGFSDTQQTVKEDYNQPQSERIGQTNNGHYDSRYSYEKRKESHDTSFVAGDAQNNQQSLSQTSNLGSAAQNKQGFLVGVLGVNQAEGQGMTTYNSGSRVASTGRQHNAQSSYSRGSNNGYTSTAQDNYQAGKASSGLNYQTDHLYDRDRTLQEETGEKPKSFHSSYSYHKSWERHGDPYMILPDGSTKPITEENDQAARSSYSQAAGNQQYGNYKGESVDSMSANLERLKQQMQMSNLCTSNCNNVKTKGYQASYSYSAQRQYGGEHDQVGIADDRFKRSPYGRNEDFDQTEDLGQQTINHGHTDLEYNKPHAQYTDHAQIHQYDQQRPTYARNIGQQNEDTQQVMNENLHQQADNKYFSGNDQISQQSTYSSRSQINREQHESQNEYYNGQRNQKPDTDIFNHLEDLKKAANEETNNYDQQRSSYIETSNKSSNNPPERSRSFIDTFYTNREKGLTTTMRVPKSDTTFMEQEEDLGQQVQQSEQLDSQLDHESQQQSSRSIYKESNHNNNLNNIQIVTTTEKPGFWTRTKDKVGSWFG